MNQNLNQSMDQSIKSNGVKSQSEVIVKNKLFVNYGTVNNNENRGDINDSKSTANRSDLQPNEEDEGRMSTIIIEDNDELIASNGTNQWSDLRHSRLVLHFSDDKRIQSENTIPNDVSIVSPSRDSNVSHKSDSNFDSNNLCWWTHPQVRRHCKEFLAAFGLLIVGIGLLATGIIVTIYPENGFQSYFFFITGIICVIPGGYHVVYIYLAVKGKRGYHLHHLPIFN